MCGVVEIWARGSRGWKREEAEETRKFCLTRSGSDLGFKRAVLFSGGGGGVKDAEEWRESWFSFFVLLRRSEEWCESFWGFSVFWRERFWLFGEGLLLGAFFF